MAVSGFFKKIINPKTAPGILNYKNQLKRRLIKPFYKNLNEVKSCRPVFIVGTNRSGSSLLTALISQNPELEGIFADQGDIIMKDGHAFGFLDSAHLWLWMSDMRQGLHKRNGGDGNIWGHPKHISNFYKDEFDDNQEKLDALNDIHSRRAYLNKRPLIKDVLFSLRIGLIKEIFPDAKFILNVRDFDEYIKSCTHKWIRSQYSEFEIDAPKIAMHWHTLNSIIYFDLMKYYPDDFIVFHHNDLYRKSSDEVTKSINDVFKFLDLPEVEKLDLSLINKKYKFVKDSSDTKEFDLTKDFKLVKKLIDFERSVK